MFSGVAGIVVAISCCAAVGKLGSERVTCPSFTFSLQDVMVKFMDLSHSLVSVEKLHQLATEAGFERDFLSNFGKKILPNKKIEDLEFWIGLAQKKLSIAFHRETMNPGGQTFPDKVIWPYFVDTISCSWTNLFVANEKFSSAFDVRSNLLIGSSRYFGHVRNFCVSWKED